LNHRKVRIRIEMDTIKKRVNAVLIENGVLQSNWKSEEYDQNAEKLIKYRKAAVLDILTEFCKEYGCSADYVLGLSPRYYGN